jgi:hypothetical protein
MFAHQLIHKKIELRVDVMRKLLILVIAVSQLPGCAVYSVVNTATYIATDKSLTDHTSSKLATADCDAVRMAVNGTYYCEVRDVSTTYNRNTF